MFGITSKTTEMFTARGALFRRERLANCNFPSDQKRTCAASSNSTHALAKYDVGAWHMQATVRFLACFRAAQAKYRLAQRPRFTLPATLTCVQQHPRVLLAQDGDPDDSA